MKHTIEHLRRRLGRRLGRRHGAGPRGYLLMEAAISGAILATAIGITFSLMAQGRAQISYASQRATAAELARTKADELASHSTCTPPGAASFVAVGAPYNQFRWRFSAANAGGTSTPPVPAGKLCEATVSVEYPAAARSAEDQNDGVMNGKGVLTVQRLWADNP